MTRSRGQLVLVAGLGLAVTFVALALLLNTVIYTENLATRGSAADGTGVVGYQRAVESGVGGVVARTNRHNYTGYDALRERLAADVATWQNATENLRVVRGEVAVVSLVDTANGTRVAQPTDRQFVDDDGAADWPVAAGFDGVRRFEATVERSSLADAGGVTAVADAVGEGVLRVNATNATATRSLLVYRHDGNGSVMVRVATDGTPTATCVAGGSRVAVDATEGTVDGERCRGLAFPALDGPYDLSVADGDGATGTYLLVVNQTLGSLPGDHLDAPGGSPVGTRAVYAATVNVTVESPDLFYGANVTVAPGDGPGVGVAG